MRRSLRTSKKAFETHGATMPNFRSTRTACKLRLQDPSAATRLQRPVISNIGRHSLYFFRHTRR